MISVGIVLLAMLLFYVVYWIPEQDMRRRQGLYATQEIRACIQNLRIVVGAKEQFAVRYSANGQCTVLHTNGTPVGMQYLLEFVKMRNPDYFRCPLGPEYVIGAVGTEPKCPIHGTVVEITTNLK